MSARPPPKILAQRVVESTVKSDELDLEFANGARRTFRRLHSPGRGAVLIVPLPDPETVLLVREYAAGVHRYELGLPRGRIDPGESPLEAAERELKEEIGQGARDLRVLRTLTLAPNYMMHEIHVVLARDLYPERLPGDEPEEIEVVPWPIARLDEVVLSAEFSEGRALGALWVALTWLNKHGR